MVFERGRQLTHTQTHTHTHTHTNIHTHSHTHARAHTHACLTVPATARDPPSPNFAVVTVIALYQQSNTTVTTL
jgi:hypothetical protein